MAIIRRDKRKLQVKTMWKRIVPGDSTREGSLVDSKASGVCATVDELLFAFPLSRYCFRDE